LVPGAFKNYNDMPLYSYKAKKGASETVSGQLSAQSQDEAIELISQMGLLPVSIREEGFKEKSADQLKPHKVKSKEMYLFSRQLANLIKAGIPILQALTILEEQTRHAYFKKVIQRISEGIKEGRTFSDCLSDYPHIFPTLYTAMVHTGEESGNLKEMLFRIAEYQRSQEEILSRVRSAMAYPILMAVLGVATVIFILSFVIPKMKDLFNQMGEALPLPTRLLLNLSQALREGWVVVLVVVVGFVFILRLGLQSTPGRMFFSKLHLGIPYLREFFLRVELGRFTRTLGVLLQSGISLIKAIQIAIPVMNNEWLKRELEKTTDDLRGGLMFAQSLKKIPLIPPLMANLILVGEESGSLAGTLHDIADSYEQETQETMKTTMTLLEPMMILAVGLIVGFIVMAILLPIFQMDILAG
jgi:type II secretory pathway component PulF